MRRTWVLAAAVAAVAAVPAAAQDPDSTTIEELKQQIEAITKQLEAIQLGREVVAEADTAMRGLGPAGSKVYRVRRGVSLGGYGELLYENFARERQDGAPSGATDQLDALRAVLYVGYKFGERLVFNSEVELEHASTDRAGSVSLEFAYLEYGFSERLGVRGGLLLVPMGFVNELHEPTTFLGTERPETERSILPSTWRAGGLGVFGTLGDVVYRLYLVSGLDAVGGGSSGADGFSAAGLRGGRQKGSKAVAERFAGVARVEYGGVLGLRIGTAAYLGDAGQGAALASDPARTVGARTFIWEGHAEYRAYGLDVRGLLALADVDDAALINEARGLVGDASVGERLLGWYLHAGYDVLRTAAGTAHQLIPFVRYERVDTQRRVPEGFAADPANDRTIVTLGVSWKPIPNIVVKGDYQWHRTDARTGVDQLSIGMGYVF